MLKTINDYRIEIRRVKIALNTTKSKHLRADYYKYLKRLEREVATYERYKINER